MTPSSLGNGEQGEGLFVGPSPLLYKLTIKQAPSARLVNKQVNQVRRLCLTCLMLSLA